MVEKKTVSQCITSDYCKGWNDAVDSIVRCKDCKHCKEFERINGYYCDWHSTDNGTLVVFADDFCSYSERKTDNA